MDFRFESLAQLSYPLFSYWPQTNVHLVQHLEYLHLILLLYFFSKIQKKLQVVVWFCHCNFFRKKFSCSEKHKASSEMIISELVFSLHKNIFEKKYHNIIRIPLAIFFCICEKIATKKSSANFLSPETKWTGLLSLFFIL